MRVKRLSSEKYPGPKSSTRTDAREKCIGIRCIEFAGIGEKREERFAVGSDVSHEHVDGENEGERAREQAEGEKDAAEKFQAGDGQSRKRGSGQAQAREKLRHVSEMVELAPAALNELHAPVQADEEQKRRLKISNEVGELIVPVFFAVVSNLSHERFGEENLQ